MASAPHPGVPWKYRIGLPVGIAVLDPRDLSAVGPSHGTLQQVVQDTPAHHESLPSGNVEPACVFLRRATRWLHYDPSDGTPVPVRTLGGLRRLPGGVAARRRGHAEALGFDTLLVADHLVEMLPPLLPLAFAAEATDRLRVGTFVINNDFRHPVVLAREAASLGMLTEGRFELGLGAGHMKPEYDQVGIPFDAAGVRVDRLAEAVPLIRMLLDGEEVTHEGEHYRVTAHRAWPVLEPAHRVPILVGGNGRACCRSPRAGRTRSAWSASPTPPRRAVCGSPTSPPPVSINTSAGCGSKPATVSTGWSSTR